MSRVATVEDLKLRVARRKAQAMSGVGRAFVHEAIADAARGIAGEFWEQMATGQKYKGRLTPSARRAANDFYRAWPDQQVFIDLKWEEFITCARAAMTLLLGKPGVDEAVKAQIFEALRLDNLINPRQLSEAAKLAKIMPKIQALMPAEPPKR